MGGARFVAVMSLSLLSLSHFFQRQRDRRNLHSVNLSTAHTQQYTSLLHHNPLLSHLTSSRFLRPPFHPIRSIHDAYKVGSTAQTRLNSSLSTVIPPHKKGTRRHCQAQQHRTRSNSRKQCLPPLSSSRIARTRSSPLNLDTVAAIA